MAIGAVGLLAGCAAARVPSTSMMDRPGYLLLADGSVHFAAPAGGLFVRGLVTAQGFVPTGEVEGDGDMSQIGAPGWLELKDGSFHGDMTARPPFPPYVRGCMRPNGRFAPAAREVRR